MMSKEEFVQECWIRNHTHGKDCFNSCKYSNDCKEILGNSRPRLTGSIRNLYDNLVKYYRKKKLKKLLEL